MTERIRKPLGNFSLIALLLFIVAGLIKERQLLTLGLLPTLLLAVTAVPLPLLAAAKLLCDQLAEACATEMRRRSPSRVVTDRSKVSAWAPRRWL